MGRAVRAGRKSNVKRNGFVFGVMVVGIALLLWAGWHNLRARRLAMQQAQESHIVLQKDGDAVSTDVEKPKLVGKQAPGFTLMTLDGKKVSMSDFKGRPVLVNFWGTYCGPCKVEMPWLEEFRTKYASDKLEVLGLVYDVEIGNETIGKEVKRLGVTYPILLTDPKVQAVYLSDSEVLPMSFYVNKNGVVVEETAGLGGKDEVEAHIKKTIASGTSLATGGQ
jgi:thiol-disulfide isomerase/thioredoxin